MYARMALRLCLCLCRFVLLLSMQMKILFATQAGNLINMNATSVHDENVDYLVLFGDQDSTVISNHDYVVSSGF